MYEPTLFFYDLETSGLDPRRQRIMQFAGQRTDMNLNLLGEPVNWLVALTEDVLPDPGAVLITGITPQKTQAEGFTEAEFLQHLYTDVLVPGTTILGFNSVRFDDEFMRYTLYRNFYDPYEWQWQDGRSRWDLLDVVRMTRALRPDGIEWPADAKGAPTNRLELITKANGLAHEQAHDALSDVLALIDVARLIRNKQPKLYDYLYSMRGKQAIAGLVNLDDPQPFVYSSGRYPKEAGHTTVVLPIAPGGTPGSVLVYDLRHDPALYANKTADELRGMRFATWEARKAPGFMALPAKELAYNRCPAVAPLGVLNPAAQQRIGLTISAIETNLAALRSSGLTDKLREVFVRKGGEFAKTTDVDGQLYDGFIDKKDAPKMSAVRAAESDTIADFHPNFIDERLHALLPRYKARNYPHSLAGDERDAWERYRSERVQADLPRFMQEMQTWAKTADGNEQTRFILQELQLWAESIAPA